MIEFSNPLYAKKAGDKYAPYAYIAEAVTLIPKSKRKINMTVNIGWIEYEWKYGLNDIDLTKKKDFDPDALTTDEILLLLSVTSGSGESLPTGTGRQIISFDSNGKAIAKEFTADMWSDFQDGAPTDGQWIAAAQFETSQEPSLGFVEVAIEGAEEGKIPFYRSGGTLKVGTGSFDQDAVNYIQVISMINAGIRNKIKDVPFDPTDMDDRVTLVALMNALKA